MRAYIYADGHDVLRAALLYRPAGESAWIEKEMRLVDNDRWQGEFKVEKLGRYAYKVVAWVDGWRSWSADLLKRAEAGQELSVDVLVGAEIVRAAAVRALTEFFENRQMLMREDFLKILRQSQNPDIKR